MARISREYSEAETARISREYSEAETARISREYSEAKTARISRDRDAPSIPTNITRRLLNNKDCRIDVAMRSSDLSTANKLKTKQERRDY
jgi:hypothetical protein